MPYNDGIHPPGTCPADFTSPAGSGNPPFCYSATVTCANVNSTTPPLGLVYSYVTPPSPIGTIVLFSEAGGVLGGLHEVNGQFVIDYYNANFEVVEVAWVNSDWEQTSDPLGIMTAACRPAGFLNYVLTTPLLNSRLSKSTNGLCAQGISAGSGAVGYSLAWYLDSNGAYLNTDYDNVELESGPVFSNIEFGCEVPQPPVLASICPPGQFGCSPATTQWSNFFSYIDPNVGSIRQWTYTATGNACNNGTATSSSNNQKWLSMSIVNGSGGSFSYPNLGMAGWLCASSQPSTVPPASLARTIAPPRAIRSSSSSPVRGK